MDPTFLRGVGGPLSAFPVAEPSRLVEGFIARNSNAFGPDLHSLAADLSGLPASLRQGLLEAIQAQLPPLQAGILERIAEEVAGVAPAPMGLDGVLSEKALEIAKKSPTLMADLTALEAEGWKVELGATGGGSYADRNTKTVTLDPNTAANDLHAVQVLAHEVGHAAFDHQPDFSSKDAYVNGALADEGMATIKNLDVRREVLAAGGPDIGLPGDPANHAGYIAAYEQYLKDGDVEKAASAIGQVFGQGEVTSTTGQTYADYYGGWYDDTFGQKQPVPLAS